MKIVPRIPQKKIHKFFDSCKRDTETIIKQCGVDFFFKFVEARKESIFFVALTRKMRR